MRKTFCAGLATAMLAACGTGAPSAPAPLYADQSLTAFVRTGTLNVAPSYEKPWRSPELTTTRSPLLFVSDDAAGAVHILKLPGLQVLGTLTGFQSPQGVCADNSGNVFIADTSQRAILEYSHAGILLKTLHDLGNPASCAVSPTSGDLAVTNIVGASYRGGVVIYRHGIDAKSHEHCHGMNKYFFDGYDENNDLYVDGQGNSGTFDLCESSPGVRMHHIRVKGGTIYFPGMVQWYTPGKYLVVGDQRCGNSATTCLYHVSISGNVGTIVGTTSLLNATGDPVCDLAQGTIVPRNPPIVLGGDLGCGKIPNSVDRWNFATGGAPLNYNNESVVGEPIGAAVSIAQPSPSP